MPEVSPARPAASLWVGVGLLAVETVLFAAVVVFLIVQDFSADAQTRSGAVGVTLFAAFVTALIGLLAWSLWRRRAWARGPAVVLHLLFIPMGWYALTGGEPAVGVPALLAAVVGAGALIAPSTRAALAHPLGRDG